MSTVPDSGTPSVSEAARTPSMLRLWHRALGYAIVGCLIATLLAWAGWWPVALVFAVLSLFMAWWVSPARVGLHTPWAEAIALRGPDHAIIIWSTLDKASASIQVGLRPDDPRLTWVNYLKEPAAAQFAAAHGGFDSLPIAILDTRVLANARSGDVLDALDHP